jgi:ABC-type sugar transport system substrate-binding protein
MIKKVLALMFAAIFVIALVSCAPAPAATEAPVVDTEAPPEAETAKTIVLGYSPPTLEMTDFYVWGQTGLERKAKELGLDIQVITKAPSTHAAAEEQLRIVEDFVTQGVDYIWVVPVSVEAGPPIFKAANDAGIPIFVGHALYDNAQELNIINVGTNFEKTGTDVGNWIADHLSCNGPVGIIRGAAGEYDGWRVESAITAMAAKCPDMKVYASDYTDWLTENGLNQAKTLLTAHPDIKIVYNPSSTLTLGTVQALDELGLTGKVEVFDYDLIPAVQKMCKEDPPKVVGGLAMLPFQYGEVVADLIDKNQKGEAMPFVNEVPGIVVTCDKLETVFPEWYLSAAQ